jgi:hypothetical protein
MATQIFFRALATATGDPPQYGSGDNRAKLDTNTSGWRVAYLSTSRGAAANGFQTNTAAGPTNGVEITGTTVPTLPMEWVSDPLDADVTISGSITWNLRALEAAMAANVAINARLEVIDGATGALTLIDQTANATELGTAEAAANFNETPAAGVACKRGDRLRCRVFGDDGGGNMASGNTFTFFANGPTGGASGDSYFTLTEDLTFVSEPAGSTVYLTDVASDVSTASVDREAWTDRDDGMVTDVTNTAAGWTAPIQVTDTAGGTVVDWFTPQLNAITLGGAARCNIRGLHSSSSANAGFRVEVARVDTNGGNATVWAVGQHWFPTSSSDTAFSFLVAGDDLAIADTDRLRIRVYIDDNSRLAMASGHTLTLDYGATSGGVAGDTFLTFTQSLTEYAPVTPKPEAMRRTLQAVPRAVM